MKTKNLGQASSGSLISILAILGLAGAAWWMIKPKFTFDPKTVTDYRNRTDDQKITEAKQIDELYAKLGQSLNQEELIKKTQEVFDLEKTILGI